MKSKVNFSTFGFEDVRELCASISKQQPKVMVCIDLWQVCMSLIRNGALPLGKEESFPHESIIGTMVIVVVKNDSTEELRPVTVGKINIEKSKGNELWYADNTECWIVNEAVLEDLLLLRMYAENRIVVGY